MIVFLLLIFLFQTIRLKSLMDYNKDAIAELSDLDKLDENSPYNKKTEEITSTATTVAAPNNGVSVSTDTQEYNVLDNQILTSRALKNTYGRMLTNRLHAGQGYVSLDRIAYFYNANPSLDLNMLYDDNLDPNTRKERKISEVCQMDKYKGMSVCNAGAYSSSGQINVNQAKPFAKPLDMNRVYVSGVFMEQRSYEVHKAWDLAISANSPVYSVCDGTVSSVGNGGGYGNYVKISCPVNGTSYDVLYAHLNSYSVGTGSHVSKGQLVARVGSTGRSTGYHLHFEVKQNGQPIDGLGLVQF